MPVKNDDIIKIDLDREETLICIENARAILKGIEDRKDLHIRDDVERFQDLLMGELAEAMVIKWLRQNGRLAVSAVDKGAMHPDAGHDIWVRDTKNNQRTCSVKSSISVFKTEPEEILDSFTLAITNSEVRDINIQVYFWLDTKSSPRISVPSLKNSAIMAWFGKSEVKAEKFASYEGERRKSLARKLRQLNPMHELLKFLS